MPMDRCWHRKLVNNVNMKPFRQLWVVTQLSLGLSESRNFYGSAKYRDGRLARE